MASTPPCRKHSGRTDEITEFVEPHLPQGAADLAAWSGARHRGHDALSSQLGKTAGWYDVGAVDALSQSARMDLDDVGWM
jgi:hypothetical protein